MPYQSFTLDTVRSRFGLTVTQATDHFAAIHPVASSNFLNELIARHLPLVLGRSNEKPRSELLVAPILVEVREQLGRQVALFSGELFNVDRKSDLYGYCDFLLSRDPLILQIEAPVVVVAEAKKEDVTAGAAQCIAGMVAAQKFNEKRGKPVTPLFGVLSSGTNWQFLQLDGTVVTFDIHEYGLFELPRILGILIYMASGVKNGGAKP
ncbi:MAG: hypothetical protein H8F28_23800 [Fibrella sp.]|nr:hypothetical protein [Armatimonadota bacterium]